MPQQNNNASKIIIIGAGFSGISAGKTLSDAGFDDFIILEATDRIGGRIRKENFTGTNVETGANWIEGVNGDEMNPIWKMAKKLNLRNFYSDNTNISCNTYKQEGGLYEVTEVKEVIKVSNNVHDAGMMLSKSLSSNGKDDISLQTMQCLQNHVPSTPLEMAVDYWSYDYEFAEPPCVTSLQHTNPLPTFANFGADIYFVADERGYETVVYDLACQFLETSKSGLIIDPRLRLNQVVRRIDQSAEGVVIEMEDHSNYEADYVMVSVSIGVLQTSLINFDPPLPENKISALHSFDMAVFTKIFLSFPFKFWPKGAGTEFFLYASERRGYYPVWQHFEKEYPGANILVVTVTDEESRRIEQQDDLQTKAEAMQVLRNLFGNNIPEATNILVPKWWSDKFFKGSFTNWPNGLNRDKFDQIRAPFERVHFTGEHTSRHYNGYVHGAYLAGIDSANTLIDSINNR